MRMIFMKFDNQNKLGMLIMNVLIGIDGLDPKLKICKIWSQKWNVLQFFLKFCTCSNSNMLIMNIVLGIDDLDPKL